jgi:hypothetical protein
MLTFDVPGYVASRAGRDEGRRLPQARRAVDSFWVAYKREAAEDPRRVIFLEVTEGTGLPHYHVLVDRRMDAAICWRVWRAIGGGGLDLVHCDFVARAVGYASEGLRAAGLPRGVWRVWAGGAVRLGLGGRHSSSWELRG